MAFALMSRMSVSVQTVMAIKSPQQQNPAYDLNLPAGAGFDNFMFDSLINNFMTRKIGRPPEQSAENTEVDSRRYIRESKEPDRPYRDSEINDRRKIRAGSQQPERGNESREITREPAQPDKYADAGNKNNSKNPDPAKKDSGPSADNSQTVKAKANDLKTGDLLFRCAGGLINKAETAVNEGAGQPGDNADTGAEKGNYTDALFNGGKTAVSKDKAQLTDNTKNVLKTAVLPAGLLKNSDSGQVDFQAALTAGDKNRQSLNSDQAKAENGLKTGRLLSEKANESTGGKGININEDMVNARVKTANSGSGNSRAVETVNLSGKNTHGGQYLVRQFLFQEAAATPAGNNSAKALSGGGLLPEFSGGLNREGGSRNSSRTVRAKSGTGNTGLPDSAGVGHGGVKGKNISQAGKPVKPPAFNDVIDRIIYVAKGNNRIGVTVENETVGKLNINLSLNKGIVNVHINAADNATREFVQNNIQHIVDSLSKNGVSVGGFSVGLRNHKDSEGNENRYGYGNGKGDNFSVDGSHEKEYLKAGENAARTGNGMISVFA